MRLKKFSTMEAKLELNADIILKKNLFVTYLKMLSAMNEPARLNATTNVRTIRPVSCQLLRGNERSDPSAVSEANEVEYDAIILEVDENEPIGSIENVLPLSHSIPESIKTYIIPILLHPSVRRALFLSYTALNPTSVIRRSIETAMFEMATSTRSP